jgi:small subunit ribosomal protein S15
MALNKDEKQNIVKQFGTNNKDTGSSRVQIALLTKRINDLNAHFQMHKKDHSSRRGLLKLVGQRRSLLNYMKRVDLGSYRTLLEELKLRK